MCSLLQPRREKESGRGAAGWLPRPAGSLGPNTALMRARGADGHTQGAQDYCPGPRGARERETRGESVRRPQQGLLKLTWSQRALDLTVLLYCEDALALVSAGICLLYDEVFASLLLRGLLSQAPLQINSS